ncbi:MAG: methyltransferase domain-containing protein [Pseudonocardiaceae bacterium]|nr:methyltransferase domain-containing protein [Pseudonocardiaceae bacterium]
MAPENVDFEAFYRGEEPIEGTNISFGQIPWDIGEPQPALVHLEETGQIRGAVLDSGCGLGDNSVFLAARGYQVTGIDGASGAIERAEQRARDRGVDVEFRQADVTRLDGIEQRFNTVLDSALYHCLGEGQRAEYAAALHRVTMPGAQLHLFCFADAAPVQFGGVTAVSQDDLYANLGQHWNITSIQLTNYVTAFTRESFREQVNVEAMEQAGLAFDIDNLDTDDQGRILGPVWQLHAERI